MIEAMNNPSLNKPLLQIRDLTVDFRTGGGVVHAVRGVSFDIEKGQTVALVGESGSGKSVTALSILQLLPYPRASHSSESQILFDGKNLAGADGTLLRTLRGRRIGMIFQEPMTSLNPLHTIEKQLNEVLILHRGLDRAAARARVRELLDLVGLPKLKDRLGAYPHELSGGQRQRVMIAMALANDPDLLIADEPTTALDVTVQAQILELLKSLKERLGMALLLITHDLTIVEKMADRVCVMKDGLIVEQKGAADLFANPQHEYTKMLLAARPKGHAVALNDNAATVMEARGVRVHFPVKAGLFGKTASWVKAVDGVSLSCRAGQTVGVVGESGSGKTTLALALLRLLPSKGDIAFQGQAINGLSGNAMRPLRAKMQVVFQDPYGSLSPRMSVGDIVGEGLQVHRSELTRAQREDLVVEALRGVHLDPETRHRYPHEFSGGQRQRISIARAMALRPDFVVLDEPTSALDVSVQAQIVDLLRELQEKNNLAYLFISHDLRVVRAMAHHLIVMKDGVVVEEGDAASIFAGPKHEYTKALLDAAIRLKAG
jgi:microcin C transport system ATP-binding protein